jgi:hypothetical protein
MPGGCRTEAAVLCPQLELIAINIRLSQKGLLQGQLLPAAQLLEKEGFLHALNSHMLQPNAGSTERLGNMVLCTKCGLGSACEYYISERSLHQ